MGVMPSESFAVLADVEKAWRPLPEALRRSAEYWLGVVSRRIRSEYPGIDDRLGVGGVTADTVRDAAVALVLPVLQALLSPDPRARGWSAAAGSESQSVQLSEGGAANLVDLLVFTDEIRRLLEGPGARGEPLPLGSFPPAGRVDAAFEEAFAPRVRWWP